MEQRIGVEVVSEGEKREGERGRDDFCFYSNSVFMYMYVSNIMPLPRFEQSQTYPCPRHFHSL